MRSDRRPAPPGAATDAGAYDWSRFGRHRLRTPAAIVIDTPLALAGQAWTATMWPDARLPGGWGRLVWELDPQAARGWLLPEALAMGDIIEFGVNSPSRSLRWYGIVDSYDVDAWLTLQGPYPHPATAHHDAERLLAPLRYSNPLRPPTDRICSRSPRRR